MSLLGNDFLPHSLSIHIREGGHDELLKQLRVPGRKRLYNGDAVNLEAVLDLIRPWAAVEEEAIAEHFRDKYSGRGPPARTPYDKAMSAANRLPIEWAEEACVWTKEGGLIPEWREISYRKWMRDSNLQTMCREFCIGLQWIMDYYHGLDVSYEWYFPWSLPPYWTDLVKYLEGEVDLTMPAPTDPLKPQEQLALVLPQASWHLLRDRKLSMLPSLIPQYWPKGFTFFSAGRKLLWECEPEIPILTAARMRGVLT
jgi:5'-3' exonuclease